jgi:hypothetical protein
MPNTLWAVVVAAVVAFAGDGMATGVATGAAAVAGAAGTADEAGAWLAGALAPPPPQATSVVPNAAIAAIRSAKL